MRRYRPGRDELLATVEEMHGPLRPGGLSLVGDAMRDVSPVVPAQPATGGTEHR
nr:hypothetical protein [Micromonospora provocatoris]